MKAEPGAVVCRVARSWIRFGSFQLPAALEEEGFVKQLADYVIKHHYTDIQGAPGLCAVLCLYVQPWDYVCNPGDSGCNLGDSEASSEDYIASLGLCVQSWEQ